MADDNTNARDNGAKGDQKAIVDAVMAALQQTAPWKYLEKMMAEDESDDDLPPDDEVQMDDVGLDDDLPPEDPLGEDDFLMDDDFDDEDDVDDDDLDDEDRPARYSAGYPGGGNTFTPLFGFDNRRRKPMPKRNSKSRTQANELRVARLSRALQATAAHVEDLHVKLRRSEREKDLIHLEAAEGILLDREEELDLVETMNEDQYRKHLARIRKNYQRAPVGGDTWFGGPGSRMPDQTRAGLTTDKDTMNRIVAHAMNRGIGYNEAKAELTGGDPTF